MSFEEINEMQILYNDRSSVRQFVRWLKEVLNVTVPNEVVLNNKDTEGLLKKLAESIEADEVALLTKLCSLYERIVARLPALVVEEVESSLSYKLKEVFVGINQEVCYSLPDEIRREIKKKG